MEQLDAGWSPLPTERPGGGDTDAEREAADAAAEADREAIEAMVAADREVMRLDGGLSSNRHSIPSRKGV